jgi:hypothetical protein
MFRFPDCLRSTTAIDAKSEAQADEAPRGLIVGVGVGDELHKKLVNDGFQPWLDEVDLILENRPIYAASRMSQLLVALCSHGNPAGRTFRGALSALTGR